MSNPVPAMALSHRRISTCWPSLALEAVADHSIMIGSPMRLEAIRSTATSDTVNLRNRWAPGKQEPIFLKIS